MVIRFHQRHKVAYFKLCLMLFGLAFSYSLLWAITSGDSSKKRKVDCSITSQALWVRQQVKILCRFSANGPRLVISYENIESDHALSYKVAVERTKKIDHPNKTFYTFGWLAFPTQSGKLKLNVPLITVNFEAVRQSSKVYAISVLELPEYLSPVLTVGSLQLDVSSSKNIFSLTNRSYFYTIRIKASGVPVAWLPKSLKNMRSSRQQEINLVKSDEKQIVTSLGMQSVKTLSYVIRQSGIAYKNVVKTELEYFDPSPSLAKSKYHKLAFKSKADLFLPFWLVTILSLVFLYYTLRFILKFGIITRRMWRKRLALLTIQRRIKGLSKIEELLTQFRQALKCYDINDKLTLEQSYLFWRNRYGNSSQIEKLMNQFTDLMYSKKHVSIEITEIDRVRKHIKLICTSKYFFKKILKRLIVDKKIFDQ